jgi:predicted transcriptional regulator
VVVNKILDDRRSRMHILMKEICARYAVKRCVTLRELMQINVNRWSMKRATFQEMLDQLEEAGYIDVDTSTQTVTPTEEGMLLAGVLRPQEPEPRREVAET